MTWGQMVTKPSATTMFIRPLLQYRIIQFTLYTDMILLGKWNHLGNIDVPIEVHWAVKHQTVRGM